MTRFRGLVLVLLFAAALRSNAGAIQKKGGVQLILPAAAGPIALADTLHLILTVEGSEALRVDVPQEMPSDSAWQIVERRPVARERIAPGRERLRFEYKIAPRAPGKKVAFTFPPVKYRDGKDEEAVVFTPVHYEVTTQFAKPDLQKLHDITAIEPLPAIEEVDSDWPLWAKAVGGAVRMVALLGMVLAIIFVWRWLRRPAPRSPAQRALAELRRLAAMKLPEKGKSERFITLLTTLVRRFLERQFSLPARRQTTPEFQRDLGETAALMADEKRLLASFFERCETVKFAQQEISREECSHWANAIGQFLEGRLNGQAGQTLAVEKNAQSG